MPPRPPLSFAGYRVGIMLDFDAMECRAYVYNRDGTEYSVLLGTLAQGITYYPAVSMFGLDEVGVELDTNPADGDTPESERARRRHIETLQEQVQQAAETTHQSEQQAETIWQLYQQAIEANQQSARQLEEVARLYDALNQRCGHLERVNRELQLANQQQLIVNQEQQTAIRELQRRLS